MILNILVLLFVVFMVYWWSGQGAFSSLLHLILTVCAALLALAVWEPLAIALLGLIPEYAWGVALLVPFGVGLLLLRVLFDRTLVGNLNFHPNVDRLMGGAFGFLAGIITAGVLVIGLQMSGQNAVLGYQGWQVAESGEAERQTNMWVPADSTAAGVLAHVADGAMSPMFGEGSKGLSHFHPNLAVEASLFHQSAFWKNPNEATRRSLNPDHLSLIENSYFILNQTPDSIASKIGVPKGGDEKTVVVGVNIALMEAPGGGGGDRDNTFYVTGNQAALIAQQPNGAGVEQHFPIGVVLYNGQYVPLKTPGEYGYSRPSVPSTKLHWVFRIPAAQEPQYVRIKQARVDLPPAEEASENVAALSQVMAYRAPVVVAPTQQDPSRSVLSNPSGGVWGVTGFEATVSDRLPFTISKNTLRSAGVELSDDAIVSGTARVSSSRERIGKELAVNRIFSPNGAKIVLVSIGRNQPGSLLGQVRGFAATVTQPPVLKDSNGQAFFAIGYAVTMNAEFKFSIDPNNVIRSLQPLELGSLADNDQMVLIYQIPNQTQLVEWSLGNASSQSMNLVVP